MGWTFSGVFLHIRQPSHGEKLGWGRKLSESRMALISRKVTDGHGVGDRLLGAQHCANSTSPSYANPLSVFLRALRVIRDSDSQSQSRTGVRRSQALLSLLLLHALTRRRRRRPGYVRYRPVLRPDAGQRQPAPARQRAGGAGWAGSGTTGAPAWPRRRDARRRAVPPTRRAGHPVTFR